MDYSEFSHTEDFLAKEIEQTLILNGIGRFSGIVTDGAGNVKDRNKDSNGVESCSEFLCQLRKYKLNESPYDNPYTRLDNPINWWSTCEDDYNNWQSNYFLIEEIVNLNGPIFDTSEITVINESISERRIETINYVAEDIAEEFL
ncbi:6998_t:CDS:2 [Entrophospora sp. SA101]|nr:6998_t:CDS:2 [Entrophospora sp. SA101]